MNAGWSTLVIVDGSNVAQCRAWRAQRHTEPRRHLVDAVASWAAMQGIEAVIVFDGAGPMGVGERSLGAAGKGVGTMGRGIGAGVRVIGSGQTEADALVEREAGAAAAAGREYWLVSSDAAVRATAGARATRTIDAESFAVAIGVPPKQFAAGRGPEDSGSGQLTRLADTLDQATSKRLERLRQGDDPPV